MAKVKAAGFYYVDDVMAMLGVSQSFAYKIIQEMNDELEKKGFFKIAGRVSQKYFHERFYCDIGHQPQ